MLFRDALRRPPRRTSLLVVTTLVASALTVVAAPVPQAAQAATGDATVGAVSATTSTTYTQNTTRSDGTVTTTYTLGGTQLSQQSPAVQTMPQRSSASAQFNPTGVNSAVVAQLGMAANNCATVANTAKDCGATGSLTLAFSKPVTDPTLHVSGLGGFVGSTNYSTYFQITGAAALGNANATASFDGVLSGSGLQATASRVQTSATRPSATCGDTSGSNSNGPAGCGSVQIRGTNLTNITLGTGIVGYGAAATAGAGVLDAFNLTTTVPASPPFTLALTKTNPDSLVAGTAASYGLAVKNTGAATATGATVVDDLPPNVAYTGVSGANWTCTAAGTVSAGQTVTCTFAGTIAAGATSSFTITATPSADAIASTVRNVAAVDPSGGASPVDPSTCTATGSPAGCAYPATQTVNGTALTCTGGDLYTLNSTDRSFYLTDPTDGSQTLAGRIAAADGTLVNGLAVTNGSGLAYALSGTAATGNKPTIYRYDPTSNTTTPFTGPTLASTSTTNGTFVAGALNPVNNVYYFGFTSGSGANLVFEVYGFDTTTNTPIAGRIARISVPANTGTTNGDFAFDRIGRLYFLATTGNGNATANPLLAVNGIVGSAGTDTAYTSKVIANLTPNDSTFNGMAFDLPTGYLYVTGRDSSGASFLKKINPSSGAQAASYTLSKSGSQVIDAASCNYNYSLTNQANIVNRAASGDQFTLSVSGGGLVAPQTATTAGSDLGLQDDLVETAGPVVTLPGNTYTVSQSASGTTVAANYTTTYVCRNLLTNAVITSGAGTSATFDFPSTTSHDGLPVGCVFTNSAYVLSLTKSNPATLSGGQPATYSFAVKNSGKSAAPTATVVDRLPANVAYTSATGTGWTCSPAGTVTAGQTVTCTFAGSIAAGATNTALAITVTPSASLARSTVQNKAAVDPDGGTNPVDPATCTATDNPAGCAVASSQTVNTGVVLGLTKSAPAPAPVVGYGSAYTLKLTNTGVNAAAGATIADQLPANVAYTSASGATCTASGTVAAGQLLSCTTTASIAANGGTYSFTVTVTPQTAAAGQAGVNKAAVDPDGGTNPPSPATCTATGTPAGCAVAPSATPVADVVKGPSPSYTTTVGTAVAAIDVKSATTSSQGKTIVNPTVATQPANGTASVNADGTLRYVPNAGFSGADSFTYRICNDGNPASCDVEPVSITVTNGFTPGPAITTPQNTSVTTPLSGIATTTGKPLDPTRVTQVAAPAHGTLAVNATTGAVTYTPATGYTGPDTYSVQVCDTSSPVQCTTVTKQVTVQANTVTARADTATTNPGTAVSIDVRANDTTTTGQPFAAPVVTGAPTRGTATVAADGTITYTPTAGKSGTDTFTYRVCDTSNPTPVCDSATVTVTVPNTVTARDDSASTPQNSTVSIPLLANDTVSSGGSPLDPASVTVTAAPSHGTVTINATTGAASFVPTTSYTGTDTFTYRVCDTSSPTPVCKTATVTVTIGANTVTAADDTATTTPGVAVSTDVRANDTTATGQPLAYPTVITQPAKGTASVDAATGRIGYTPTTGTGGVDTYRYRVCDTSTPNPVCATATVTVTVANTVTAVADSASTAQNTAVVLDVPANDTVTANGPALNRGSVTVTVAPAHGATAVDATTGRVTFTPTTGYTGSDVFTYRICDTSTPTPTCASATATITIGANTVTANPDTDSTTPGVAVTTNVRANDTTATGQPLAAPTVTTQPAKGTTTVNANGTITYTPSAGTSGVDTYRYQVCDTSTPTPVCATTTVTITVANAVKANDDVTSTPQNTATVTTVLANDTVSPNGAALNPASVTVVTAPLRGTAVANADGTIRYTPAAGYTGADSYAYRVCDRSTPTPTCSTATVTVTVGANTVTARNDTAATTPGVAVNTDVRANDTTATGQPLAAPVVQTQPAKGTAAVNPDGTIRYTPTSGTSGTDSYTYAVCDTSTPNPVCAQATVTITVTNTVTAVDDSASTAQNTSVSVSVLTNDTVSANGAPLNRAGVSVTTAPGHGTTSVNTTTGAITFTPIAGYTGSDVFTYQVCDTSTPTPRCASANVTIAVGANVVTANPDTATTPPGTSVALDVRANDTSTTGQPLANPTIVTPPASGTVTVGATSGRVVYTPAANTSGVFTFGYRVCDTSTPTPVCSQSTVTVTVPTTVTAVDDSAATAQNTAVNTAVLGNDTVTANAAPLDPASATVTTAAAHGSTVVNANGTVTYTPATGYSGPDSYRYRVCDTSTPTPQCASATVTLTVGGNTVTAADDAATTTPRTPVTTNVRANDTTSTGQPLTTTTIVTQAPHGTATVEADGRVTYTPQDGFTGAFTYRYRVCDNSSPTPFCGEANVAVTVTNTVTPVADSSTLAQNTVANPSSSTTDVVANDKVTAGGAPLDRSSLTITSSPVHGTATANSDGTIRYVPAVGYAGPDLLTYQICDTSSPTPVCAKASLSLTVTANTVTARDDIAGTTPGTAVATNVRGNDLTATGQPFANPTVVTAPTKGTTAVNADGTVTYTPTTGTSGVDTYRYRVCDTSDPTPVCSTATVTVTVASVVTARDDTDTTAQNASVTTAVLDNDSVSPNGAPLRPASVAVTVAAAHGTTSVNTTTGAVTYIPAAGYSGPDSYRYQVCDTSSPTPNCATALVSLTVRANTVTAVPDTATTAPVTAVDVDVRANDTTASGQALAAPTVVTGPAHGTATVVDGTIRYRPANGFSGRDVLTYQVCDTGATPACASTTLTITVPNTVRAVDDVASTPQNRAVTTTVTANDTVTAGGAALDPASVRVTSAPAHGTTSVNATTGAVTYTPASGYSGTDSYDYRVCDTSDPTPVCSTATATVTVGGNTVTAADDSAQTNPATPVDVNVRGNDSSGTGQPLANPVVTAAPGHGSTAVNASTGVITYTPAAGFSGVDTFGYRVCDTSNPTPVCAAATVTIAVRNVVTAVDDAASTPQNTSVAVTVLGNDTVSANGAPLDKTSVAITTGAAHGTTAVDAATGVVTYTPVAGYSGTDSVRYRVCDTSSPTPVCASATVTLTVGANRVTAGDDSATTGAGNPVTTNVKANDTTATGQPLAAKPSIATAPAKGSIVVNDDGTITYTPTAGQSGLDTYRYTICDTSTPTAVCATATVTVTVTNVVTAVADSVATAQNTAVIVNELANDTISGRGAPLDPASVTVTAQPAHGAVVVNANGTTTYTPATGYTGSDSYGYRVCDSSTPTPVCASSTVTVAVGGNSVSANDDSVSTLPGTAVTVNVRANDSSSTGQPFANPTIVTAPAKGSAVVNADGTITYTPTNGTSGRDSLTYRVCDTSTPTPVCATATLTVAVGNRVTAVNDTSATAQNTAVVTDVLANDSVRANGAPLNPASVTVTTAPQHGTTVVATATGAITYTPAAGYSGADSYVYQVCDRSTPTPQCGTASVAVTVGANTVTARADTAATTPGNAVTTDVRANDTTATGQALAVPVVTVAPTKGSSGVNPDGTITYLPAAGTSGTDTYSYRVCDTSNPTPVCDTATVTVTVANTVRAVDDTSATAQNAAVAITVLANDTVSSNGSPLRPASVTVTSAPAHGTTTVADGVVTYTPDAGYSGDDSFRYRVCDGSSPTPVCDTATVTVSVGANTVAANDDTDTTRPGTAVTTDVRANDTSGSGQALGTPSVLTQPGHGTAAVTAGGAIAYTPANGFSGVDSYTYRICDTGITPVCANATVTVTVDNAVTAGPDSASVAQNGTVAVAVLANDTVSANGSPLRPASVTVTTAPAHGTATPDANGVIVYTPTTSYSGPDSFAYRVCDGSTPAPKCDVATVAITVRANTVIAYADDFETPAGTAFTGDVRLNDSSASGQALDLPTIVTAPTNGTVRVNADGTITYTPAAGKSGTDSFSYAICDTSTPTKVCAQATATATVAVVNEVDAVNDTAAVAQNGTVTTPVLANDTVTAGGASLNPASVTITSGPAHGTVSVNAVNGAVTYTPTAGFSGSDAYTYRVCDRSTPSPVCDTAVVAVTVGSNTVVASNDNAATTPGNPVTTNVRANDSSASGQALAPPTIVRAPGKGTVSVGTGSTAGSITYTPTDGTSGTDSYDYRVCDTGSPAACATATVTVTVTSTVTARTDTAATAQNSAVAITVLANDSGSARGAPLNPASVTVTTAATHGGTAVDSAGVITYTPVAGYSGTDVFAYSVCDRSTPDPVCSTATVSVTVRDNAVAAGNDADSTVPGRAVVTTVLANDTSASGQAFAAPTIVTQPAKGTVSVNADKTVTYTPAANTSGVDTYRYRVCDTGSNPVCATATVTVTVVDTVTARDDAVSVSQNGTVTTPVLGNDTATPGGAGLDPTSVTVVTPAGHGTTTVTPAGAVTYTPARGYSGSDTYRYRVCDASTPTPYCDTATVAVTVGGNTVTAVDDTTTTLPGNSQTTDVRANDTSATGQPLANPTIVTAPAKGSAVVNANGTIRYTPTAGTSGVDTYRYRVCDTGSPAVCAEATVTVSVPNTVTAVNDSASIAQNRAISTPVLGNDTVAASGAPLNPASVAVVTPAGHGSTTVDATSGAVTYTPNAGFSGTDTYAYRVCDRSTPDPVCGTAVVTVTVGGNTVTANPDSAATVPGVAVTTDVRTNDSSGSGQPLAAPTVVDQPAKGTATVTDGKIVYAPTPGTSGTDTYRYRVCDTGNPPVCDTATVTVTVTNVVNAVGDPTSTPQNKPVTTNVTANDRISANGAPLDRGSVTVVVGANHGTTAVSNGNVTYTPGAGFTGTDGYTYSVCDTSTPSPVCDTAVVSVAVGANTVTAGDDTDTTTPGTPVRTGVYRNDSSASGQPLANATIVTAPARGTAVVNADGSITYTPANGTSGVDTYRYRVCDTGTPAVCATATVTITVPSAVTAADDTASTPQNGSVTTAVLGNDRTTANGAPLDPASVAVVTAPGHGTAAVDTATGAVTYVPAAGYSGPDSYRYQVCDTSAPTAVCDAATVSINVTANVVTARADTVGTTPGVAVSVPVLDNDTSGTGQPLANPTVVTAPAKGSVAVTGATIGYTPNPGTSGVDTFTYRVCDTGATPVCATATVTVTVANTVTAANDTATVAQNGSVVTPVLGNDRVSANGAPLNPASVTVVAAPQHGSASVDTATGAVTFAPTRGYTGPDGYTYRVCDTSTPTPVCDTATVTVTVGRNTVAVNADAATTVPGTPVTTDVRANDSSSSGQAFAAPVVITAPAKGTAVVNADGTVTYTPNRGSAGADNYTYRVCDTGTPSVCGTATVSVTVANTVTVRGDTASTAQNTSVVTTVLGNDTVSPDGPALVPGTVVVTLAPAHGTTSVSATGAITYTPAAGYSGADGYTYRVCDGSTPTPVCGSATVAVSVGQNTVAANDDTAATTPGTAVIVNVRANDSSGSGQPLAAPTVVTAPAKGSVTVDGQGNPVYTPNAGTGGADSFTYRVCDTGTPPACGTATVRVSVTNTVTATADTVTTGQNKPVTTTVLGNDSVSVGGAPLDAGSVTITSPAQHGTAVANADGTIRYTPAAGYSGADGYGYQVCDTSTPTPVCATATVSITVGSNTVTARADTATTTPGTPVTTDVRGNDTSTSNQALAAPVVTTQPAKGTARANPDGTITYTPTAGTSGTDSYTYRVCDTGSPVVCGTATVTVNVVNTVGAVADSATAAQNGSVTTPVLGNDTVTPGGAPLDPATVTITAGAAHGTTTVDNGTVTYTPNPGYSGSDGYTYRVCDTSTPTRACGSATVTLTVGGNTVVANADSVSTVPGNPVTANVKANDSSTSGQPLGLPEIVTPPAEGTAVVNPDGTITYTPNPGTSGTDSFGYQVCDTGNPKVCSTASASVTVSVADQVDAADDDVATAQNRAVTTPVLANDSVSSGAAPLDPASVSITVPATHGTAVVKPDGTITYTPAGGYSGVDRYAYRVCDRSTPSPVCDTATVTVTVGLGTVAAGDDTVGTTPGNPVTVDVRANDSSGSGQSLATPTIVTAPGKGTAAVNPDGTVTYAPADGTAGSDSFVYRVCDTSTPNPVCNTATVTVTVANTVTATRDTAATAQNTAVRVPVLANDTSTTKGPSLDPASVTVTVAPLHGSTSVVDGAVVYTPTRGFSGTDSFTYSVCDRSTPTPVCAETTATITVGGNTVAATPDTATTTPGRSVTTPVLGNDTSASGQALGNPAVVTPPAHGTVVVNPDGTITYTPDLGFSGSDEYTYQVCDTGTPVACGRANVTVTVPNTVVANPDQLVTQVDLAETVNLLGNDTVTAGGAPLDPASVRVTIAPVHGTATVAADGVLTYTPNPGYAGPDVLTYRVCDRSTPTPVCDTTTVSIQVLARPVEATDDRATTAPGTPVTIRVEDNDATATGRPLAPPTLKSQPAKGTAKVVNGAIVYTPNPGTSGEDSFDYEVCDTSPVPVCSSATVRVTVAAAVTATDDAYATKQNTPLTMPVTGDDTATGAPLNPASVTVTVAPAHGTATANADGTITYVPSAGYTGPDSFDYRVCDGSTPTPVCDDATVTVTVGANVVTPKPDRASTSRGRPVVTPVLGNDTVATGGAPLDPSSVRVTAAPAHGTTTVDPVTGAITYRPAAGFTGTDRYTYRVCDTSTPTPVCATTTVTVTVRPGAAPTTPSTPSDPSDPGGTGSGGSAGGSSGDGSTGGSSQGSDSGSDSGGSSGGGADPADGNRNAGSAGGTAYTGVPVTALILLALLAFAAGAVLLLAGRRRAGRSRP